MSNYLGLKVQLDPLPEEEEEDTGPDYPYWYIGVPVFAIGGILFVVAYKWAAASQVRENQLKWCTLLDRSRHCMSLLFGPFFSETSFVSCVTRDFCFGAHKNAIF